MVSRAIEVRLLEITTDNNIKSWLNNNLFHYRYIIKPPIWELLGISRKTWYNYLNSTTPIPHTVLAKLLIILEPWGCTYDDLINSKRQ